MAKSDTVAGLPAPVAKDLVGLHYGSTFVRQMDDNILRKNGVEDTGAAIARMEKAGYLVKAEIGDHSHVWWEATNRGNALAIAGFGKKASTESCEGDEDHLDVARPAHQRVRQARGAL